jgi:hypothetical protein
MRGRSGAGRITCVRHGEGDAVHGGKAYRLHAQRREDAGAHREDHAGDGTEGVAVDDHGYSAGLASLVPAALVGYGGTRR